MTEANNIPDEKNPEFLLNGVDTELIVKIAKGEIDVVELAKTELKNRYLDIDGNWVRS